jgi:hypothetical protein
MTNFLAEQAELIDDATQGDQGRSARDREAARGPGLRHRRLTDASRGSATDQNPPCSAGLMLAGRHYHCDLATDAHGRRDGWRHSSKAAEAIWCDDAATEWGDQPAVPLTFKDIGDMQGTLGWREFETVPSQRLIDALTSDIRDVPNGHAQPELE